MSVGLSAQPILPPSQDTLDPQLIDLARTCYDDPERFVRVAYPWQEKDTFLEYHAGPDKWQLEFLRGIGTEVKRNAFDGHTPVMPILRAVSSGHGAGKSVVTAFLVDWIMVTRPHSQGVVTANTQAQLDTKTWAAIRRWSRMMLWAHWFEINTQKMYHKAFPESWFCTAQTCREENSEAFAGQHAADSTSFFIMDEDSAIPAIIHEVAEGGLTDGEPMMLRFGNPTRNNGDFFECCFGKKRDRWHPVVVDSRTSRFSNKALIQSWEEEHGEDSDFFRVRVRGLPPRASDLQFIDQERIWDAQKREITAFDDDPLIAGVDCSGGGAAWNIVRFRRGLDGRTVPPVRVPGEATRRDRSAFLSILANVLSDRTPGKKVAMMFVDSAYGAPYVERLRAMGYSHCIEVNFEAGNSPDELHCSNMRAYMYQQAKDWLVYGGIPEEDHLLASDLSAPGHHLDRRNRLRIESKESMAKRGVGGLHDGDGFCLTFAAPVVPRKQPPARKKRRERFLGKGGRSRGMGWTH